MNFPDWTLARIIRLPIGEAPEEIRRDWLDLAVSGRFIGVKTGAGILTGDESAPRDTFVIPFGIVVETLMAAGRTKAADYWRTHMENKGYSAHDVLLFGTDEVEVVNRVSPE